MKFSSRILQQLARYIVLKKHWNATIFTSIGDAGCGDYIQFRYPILQSVGLMSTTKNFPRSQLSSGSLGNRQLRPSLQPCPDIRNHIPVSSNQGDLEYIYRRSVYQCEWRLSGLQFDEHRDRCNYSGYADAKAMEATYIPNGKITTMYHICAWWLVSI